MLLLVGLGNPGSGYANNRHNIGFMALDAIVRHYSFSSFSKKFHGNIADGVIDGERVIALKPDTYMNDSGRSVSAVCNYFKIEPNRIFVFHDELDLANAKVRVKRGGGHSGHNGLRSIHKHIGPDYCRVRIGIGHPGDKNLVIGHVLKDFSKDDTEWLNKVLEAISTNANLLVSGCDNDFMTFVAAKLRPLNFKKTDNENGV
ncbi:MAG: aminoacyl-tRNA hydrolase [Pseudomonadota bacterium]|nr:aminoacyl-tRNA hydrolase [Pseudomonadota bacterium]